MRSGTRAEALVRVVAVPVDLAERLREEKEQRTSCCWWLIVLFEILVLCVFCFVLERVNSWLG